MNKPATITAIAFSALALASCSSQATNNSKAADTSTQTTAQENAEETKSSEATATPTSSTAARTQTPTSAETASQTSSGYFDTAAMKSEFEKLGYLCDNGIDCIKIEGSVAYGIELDKDSIEAEVKGDENLDPHFRSILSDVGTAFGNWDFGGASWEDIESWAMDASDDQEEVLGEVELEHESGTDDGVPERELKVELHDR